MSKYAPIGDPTTDHMSEAKTRLFAYVPGSPNDTNAQAKLGRMQGWTAKQLEAALPAWYKAHRATWLTKSFKPDLRMHLPNRLTTHGDPWCASDFQGLNCETTATYVESWNRRHHPGR